eukprot:CAMPEP_0171778790 /NCGR_PEP_ID=MMETSP0991-20121206/58621_1 /TAXON_ID=483369 /ORGANISM="non described non described, Strain CCMP2098" /LENGTH=103 /DNA_ID=CAMNT_0012385831 /DNA_START=168 /DNA_END=479 /DNA_ORIENTATION=+
MSSSPYSSSSSRPTRSSTTPRTSLHALPATLAPLRSTCTSDLAAAFAAPFAAPPATCAAPRKKRLAPRTTEDTSSLTASLTVTAAGALAARPRPRAFEADVLD